MRRSESKTQLGIAVDLMNRIEARYNVVRDLLRAHDREALETSEDREDREDPETSETSEESLISETNCPAREGSTLRSAFTPVSCIVSSGVPASWPSTSND